MSRQGQCQGYRSVYFKMTRMTAAAACAITQIQAISLMKEVVVLKVPTTSTTLFLHNPPLSAPHCPILMHEW